MTPSELKRLHEAHNPESYFFTRDTMRFFGDTMRNYGVRSACSNTWELYRKQPVNGGLQSSAFFNKLTFQRTD